MRYPWYGSNLYLEMCLTMHYVKPKRCLSCTISQKKTCFRDVCVRLRELGKKVSLFKEALRNDFKIF
jgi:hypothetical protein